MKQGTQSVSPGSVPPEPGEYPCRLCGAPTTRIGGFCSRDCEHDWRDGARPEDVFEGIMFGEEKKAHR
jgi:hypothetical protein